MSEPLRGAPVTRRYFVEKAVTCGAHLTLLSLFSPGLVRRAFAKRPFSIVVAQEPWGRIEQVAEGVWALISTPLQDRTTLCNGGIVHGSSGVAIIEAVAQPRGAQWLAERARELTGRWPDHVIVTHYHGDHTGGLAGFQRENGTPRILATTSTRDLVREQDARRPEAADAMKSALLQGVTPLDTALATTLDLGNRRLIITPHDGHTRSDVSIVVDEPAVVFCGDLVWNGMFPNYVDAIPSRLSRSVRSLQRDGSAAYVPGHGNMADSEDLRRFIGLLDDVEAAARRAHERGVSAADAARDYRPPPSLGEWYMFSPRYYEVALGAWLRELGVN